MSQSQQKLQYTKNYEQLNLLGRGAYGSAFLARHKIDGIYYVAKKMMLQGMGEKEVALAWGQIEILKKFNELRTPFIVEYKECYHFDNTLIIVMEYCEHGDLQTFLKNWKKKGELLDERVIVNWFIQLLFGVKILHSKKVLHRDLKSANVFLTSNKTLKIGDFGISKVLDNTSAKTFVGTPYYLSPQVCENRPYSLSSDLWSLGCIIYELCTFTYPFNASNLLGLAMKILTDEVKPISQKYSSQLNSIIMKLFIKNQKQRITIDEIIQLPFIQKHIKTYIEDQQKINTLIVIGKKQIRPQQQQQQEINKEKTIKKTIKNDNDQTMKTISSVMQNTRGKNDTLAFSQSLTPKQQMKLRKQEQIRQDQAIKKQAAIQNAASMNKFAKQKKNQNLATSGNNFNNSMKNVSQKLQQKWQNQNKQKAELGKTRQRLQKMQVINTEQLCSTLNKLMTGNFNKTMNHQFEQVHLPQNQQTIKRNQKDVLIDDRPIKPSKNQQYVIQEEDSFFSEQDLEQYYDEGFQQYIEQQPQNKSVATKEEFEDVKAFYQNEIDSGSMSPTKKSKIAQTFKIESITVNSTPDKKISSKSKQCIDLIGQKKFKELYQKVKNGQIQYKTLKTQYNEQQRQAITLIDEIIYCESVL